MQQHHESPGSSSPAPDPSTPYDGAASPSSSDIRRWRQYLADERAEAAVYRELAQRRDGEERQILLALAEAEATSTGESVVRDGRGRATGAGGSVRAAAVLVSMLARVRGAAWRIAYRCLMTSAIRRGLTRRADTSVIARMR